MTDYSKLPESALVGLALLILKRTRLSLPVENREQALSVIRGVRPAPPRKLPHGIKPSGSRCINCYAPLLSGSLCDSLGKAHIVCPR